MTETTGMQFDRAEFDHAQPAATCATCATSVQQQYYEVNGEMVCTECGLQLQTSADRGTRASRVIRACGAGLAAAIGGSVLYWAILAMTGYEFGLIAVVVGFGVGRAVNWGSRGKGGWRYQTIAMSLTYLALVGAYVPLLVSGLAEQSAAAESQAASQTPAQSPEAAPAEPTLAGGLYALAILIVIICALPFMQGIQNVLGILILGFGLYEAWKLNRRIDLVVTGPHAIAQVQAT